MRIIFLFFTILLVSGCSKNDHQTLPVTEPTRLSRLVMLDTTKTAPFDTTSMTSFQYDVQGRLTKSTLWSFEPNTWVYSPTVSYNFYYSGTDSMPVRIWEDQHYNNAYPIEKTHYLFYDAAFSLIKDSLLHADPFLSKKIRNTIRKFFFAS